jgi:hypothetical protein
MRISLRGLYPRYTLLSVLLCHCRSSANDLLWLNASVRRNTTAKQMTPFGVFGEGCGRATVMHRWFDARLASTVARIWLIGQERRYGATHILNSKYRRTTRISK